MSKTDMQTWLLEKVVPSEAASAVAIPTMPSFVSKLTPELQLQYYLKKEEQEKKLELAKLKLEAEERGRERERERDKAREAEERDRAREAELTLELKRLEVSQSQNVTVVGAAPAFKLENAIKLLLKFNKQNVEEYLIGFEKVAEINNWPQDSNASVLHAILVGKGLKVCRT